MSLRDSLGPQLPYLRRYARALTGSQTLGDAAVRETLEALLLAPEEFDETAPPRVELYRIFHRLWKGMGGIADADSLVARLPVHARESLLLHAIEGFGVDEIVTILDSSIELVEREIRESRESLAKSLQAKVMIIEDESIIALHIKSIAEELGHEITGIARTRSEAIAMAAITTPELVLADISLADGSSGIEAVNDVLDVMDVPVIFITAFPERLLTGERPEPTYLITKPFEQQTVAATIGLALLVHRENQTSGSLAADQAIGDDVPNPRKHFDTPEILLADPGLSDDQKQSLLTEWDSEMDGRLNAEAEGMSASDPMSTRKEARLADEAGKVKTALTELAAKNSSA
ncbi:response regulator [Sphingorhabdus pulchriflava]|uniref:Response regulator n=1 Tax=Sphingorhabdus pulchriflava TaxID=2292257 RepID=A0A371BEY1_9SPHN|nr:response regulator [Sphingorhabdus pulchriflava]RDV06120.1 response regulator [Sphingorhabdus pulchriflava]